MLFSPHNKLWSPPLPIPIPKYTLLAQLSRLATEALRTGSLTIKLDTPGNAKRLRQQFYSARKHLAEGGTTESPLFEVELSLQETSLTLLPQGSTLSTLEIVNGAGEAFQLSPPVKQSPDAEEQIFALELDLASRFGPGDYHQQAKELYYSRSPSRD
jgi:hypothetical protein